MQINSINYDKNCCPKPQNIFFEGKKRVVMSDFPASDIAKNKHILAQNALEEIEHLQSDINMLTYSKAIDTRMRVAKEAKEKLAQLRQFFAKLSARSIKK